MSADNGGDRRLEDFKESIRRELDSVWAELGERRASRWKTITLFVIVGCSILSSAVAILLALIGGH